MFIYKLQNLKKKLCSRCTSTCSKEFYAPVIIIFSCPLGTCDSINLVISNKQQTRKTDGPQKNEPTYCALLLVWCLWWHSHFPGKLYGSGTPLDDACWDGSVCSRDCCYTWLAYTPRPPWNQRCWLSPASSWPSCDSLASVQSYSSGISQLYSTKAIIRTGYYHLEHYCTWINKDGL